MQPFAAAYVNHVGIRDRHRNRADGAGRLLVEDRYPGAAVVGRLPHAAITYADVKDVRLTGHSSGGLGASATERADRPPVEWLEEIRVELLLRQHRGSGSNQDHVRE